MSYRIPIQS